VNAGTVFRVFLVATLASVALAGSARADTEPEPPPEPPRPSAPVVIERPSVRGLPHKGQLVWCDTGSWEGVTSGFVWQWSLDGQPRVGQTGVVYSVRGTDVGHALTCVVTGANGVGSTTAESPPFEIVRVAVAVTLDTELRQHGPTLWFEGRVSSEGPPAHGRVELERAGRVVSRSELAQGGSFRLRESIWGLTPGPLQVRIRFQPRDPALHEPADAPLRLAIVSPPTFPFPRSPLERRATLFDGLPRFWNDGGACSTGCRPRGARPGWPLEPFAVQHGLRAGINEQRDRGFHLGIDIQAHAWAPVYAMQPGRARILVPSGGEARVQIGSYVYWHLKLLVREGEWVRAFDEPIGTVFRRHRHLHLSELDGTGGYLNPLRPGGRVLTPWEDREPPVVGKPVVHADGAFTVRAFDPQSFEERTSYLTPVLAPAALAWRAFDAHGRPLGALRWALRGTHVLPAHLRPTVFTESAHRPGFACFAFEPLCIPHWEYRLGRLTDVTRSDDGSRLRRLTVYAWDWRGNTTARDLLLGR
jgi:hypothetical protein